MVLMSSRRGLRAALSFAFCFWCACCGGTIYGWSALSSSIGERCGSPFDVNRIFAFGQLGNVGLLIGLLYRSSKSGRGAQRVVLWLALPLLCVGTGLIM